MEQRTRVFNAQDRARGQEAQRAARERGASLRRDFLDAGRWTTLARARGLRLPPWYQAPTPRYMRRWLARVDSPVSVYLEWASEPNLRAFARANPRWPLRAWVGLVLEWQASVQGESDPDAQL